MHSLLNSWVNLLDVWLVRPLVTESQSKSRGRQTSIEQMLSFMSNISLQWMLNE